MKIIYFFISISCFLKAEAQKTSALPIADSLYSVGKLTEAITTYKTIEPKTEPIYLKIARAEKARGTLDEALHNYCKAATGTHQTVAMNEYGKLLYSTSHYREADSIFSLLQEVFPQNPGFYYQRGLVRKKYRPITDKNQDSIKEPAKTESTYKDDFARAVGLDSTHQKALYELALFHLQQKDFTTVENLCRKGLENYPKDVKMISLLAQDRFSLGYVSEASALFEQLLDLGQNSQFIHEKLAMCYYKRRFYKKAIEQYAVVLPQDPRNYEIHENLSKLYNLTEESAKAEKHAKIALELKDLPLSSNYFTLGTAYRLSKKWNLALDMFSKCLHQDPDHKKARYYKAVAADNYYEDDREVLRLYDAFIERYKDTDYADYDPMLKRARERRNMLNKEIFMADGNG